jgi:rhomboid protease GluP
MDPHAIAAARANPGGRAYNSPVTEPEALPRSEIAANGEVARGFTAAPVAAALIAANVGVFAAQVFLSGEIRYALAMPDRVLRWLGANASLWTIADNRFETLLTSCFLHTSIPHLVVNMLVLWQVGPLLERAIGSARFFPLYLASGMVASASSAIWGRFFTPTMSVGASGALCGLLAAAMVVGIRTEGWSSDLTKGMGRWLGLFIVIGLVRWVAKVQYGNDLAQIDNAAHIGGALAGAMIATTWQRGFTYVMRSQQAILAACVGLVLASGGIVYVRNRTDPYLFMDVDERMKAAYSALQAGRCDRARSAMGRAIQMDPDNRYIRALGSEIDRECSDPSSDRPTPNLRRP